MKWHPRALIFIIATIIIVVYFNLLWCPDHHQDQMRPSAKASPTAMIIKLKSQQRIKNKHHQLVKTPVVAKALPKPLTPSKKVIVKVKKQSNHHAPTKPQPVIANNPSESVLEPMAKQAETPIIQKNREQTAQVARSASVMEQQDIIRDSEFKASEMAKYMRHVRQFIAKNKGYPRAAQIRRHHGVVTISFEIAANGLVSKTKLVKRCRSRFLNKSASLLLSTLRFKSVPEAIVGQFPKLVVLDVNFKLG